MGIFTGTPFDLESYAPVSEQNAQELNAKADELGAEAREANQRSDNFVLVAVIMASVLFFAGVGTKFKGRGIRLVMLAMAFVLFVAVYQLNPDYLMVLFTDPMGKKMLAAAIFMQIVGALVIRKIVNIKV